MERILRQKKMPPQAGRKYAFPKITGMISDKRTAVKMPVPGNEG